jgi:LysM repeat protein
MVTNNQTHPSDAEPGQHLKIPPADFHPTELTHRVLPGETLSGLAALSGVDPAAIAARNGLSNPNQVFAGQELIIPLP